MLTYTAPEFLDSGSIVARTLGHDTGITREPGTQLHEMVCDTNGSCHEGDRLDITNESGSTDMD